MIGNQQNNNEKKSTFNNGDGDNDNAINNNDVLSSCRVIRQAPMSPPSKEKVETLFKYVDVNQAYVVHALCIVLNCKNNYMQEY